MSVDLWTLDLSVLNSLGVDTLKMDGQSRKDLIKVWRMMLGFKNFKFPRSRVHHLHCDSSNHVPLFLNLSGLEPPPTKKCFRFELMWLSDNCYRETIEASWYSSISEIGENAIIKKVEMCGKDLAWWNQNIFGNVRLELERKRKLSVQAEMEAVSSGLNFWVRELKHETNILLDREAQMWKQRSRVLWLSNGDSNTKFFHTKAT